MRKQVITFIQFARELKMGDSILNNNHTVVTIRAIQFFVSRGRAMVEIAFALDEPSLMFEEEDLIITIE
jgi:hypothetical protein